MVLWFGNLKFSWLSLALFYLLFAPLVSTQILFFVPHELPQILLHFSQGFFGSLMSSLCDFFSYINVCSPENLSNFRCFVMRTFFVQPLRLQLGL